MAIDLDVHGNTQPLEAAVQAAVNRIRRTPIKVTVDDRGATQPLGNMKRGADEFTKSMEAANARILAFGASMAIINGVADSFKAMVRNMVEVEKAMADINVVMGLSAQNLEKFGDGLFKVAKETGAAFNIAAAAATEYARQGLAVEESLKRTRDALILTRLTGMDSAEAVKSLTAAMNTYGHQIKDTTQLVSKFAAVDVQFAVSAEDFAQAISRTGAAAKDAGVDIDELIGIVTAAQQQTARGGAVIGNSLKTIFTRVGRTDTLNQLENLGIAVRDLEGNTLGAKRILTDLANTFDKLSEAQKAQIAQTVGGVFQINILKAILGDAAKQNGILAKATQISAGATDEAIDKNEQLRNTMAAMATETGLALKELSSQIGEIMLAPGMEKVLNAVKSFSEGVSGMLGDGESIGGKFATGFLKGVGNIITGPGLIGIIAVLGKLMGQAFKFTKESLGSLIGVTSEAQKQKAIQTSLVTLFGQNAALNKEMLRTDISRTEKEKIILGLLQAQTVEANKLNTISKQLASTLYTRGYGPNLTTGRGKAYGHIPNFAHPEREQAAKGGYAAGTIRSMNMPGEGSVIYNSAETVKNFAGFKQPAIMPPQSSKAGKNYQQAFGSIHGFDPYAAGGYIPNYAVDIYSKKTVLDKNRGFAEYLTLQQAIQRKGISSQQINKVWGPGASAALSYSSQLKRKKESQASRATAAMLVPPEGYMRPIASYSPKGGKSMSWPVYKLSFNKSRKQPNLEREVDEASRNIGTKYSNAISLGLGNKDPISKGEFTNFLTKAKGSEGAIGAAVGSIFEAAVNTALKYSAESSDEGGDFDVRGGKRLSELSKVFHGFPASMRLADYKNSDSQGNRISFYKKLIKEKKAAYGHIPNFADPLSDAIGREKAAGVPVSQIRVGSHGALMSKGNPLGLGVTNTYDEPNGLRDVFGANGFVPNYATPSVSAGDIVPDPKFQRLQKTQQQLADQYNKVLKRLIDRYEKGIGTHGQLNNNIQRLNSKYNIAAATQDRVTSEVNKNIGVIGKLNQARRRYTNSISNANKSFGGTAAGKAFASSGGQMALMMGLPMAGGFIQDAVGGTAGTAIGGAMTGAATGASIGMMFGPLGTAIGTTVGAFGGLISALKEAKVAEKEKIAEQRKASLTYATGVASGGLQVMQSVQGMPEYSDKDIYSSLPESVRANIRLMNVPELDASGRRVAQTATTGFKQLREWGLLPTFPRQMIADQDIAGMQGLTKQNVISKYRPKVEMETFKQRVLGLPEDKTFFTEEILSKEKREEMAKKGISPRKRLYSPGQYVEALENLSAEEEAQYLEQIKNLYKEHVDLTTKQNEAVILQLNIQRAMVTAQQQSRLKQLDIKDNFSKISNSLDLQSKIMGNFATEQQKAQMNYTKSMNRAAETYSLSAQGEEERFRSGLLGFVKDPNIGSKLKTALAKQQLQKEKEGFPKEFTSPTKEEIENRAKILDLTKQLSELTTQELETKLRSLGLSPTEIQQIENLKTAKEGNLELALKELTASRERLSAEFKINDAIARRKDILANMKFGSEMMGQVVGHGQAMRGLRSQVGAAERLTALGPGYQTRAAQEDFQMNEKRIQMEDRIKTIRENAQVQLSQEREKLADILMQNQQLKDLQDKKGELSKEDLNTMNSLIASQGERDKALIKIENAQSNINEKAKEEISTAKKLLELEGKRLKAIRERQTGPGAFRNGISDGMAKMREQVEYMDYELAEKIPGALADGLATAMTEGLSGAKDIGDALRDAGIGFLQMIQQAMMQKAAGNIVSMLPFSRGGNVRNYSRGGNVPAMVSNGEYVMGKDAVSKYGGSFMHSLNAGGRIPGYSSGGSTVGDFFSQPIASPKSKSLLENYFSKPAQTSHSPQEIRRMIGSNAARKNFGPSIGSGKGSFMGKFPGKEVFSAINPTGGGFMSKLLEMLLSPFKAFGSFFGIPGFNEGGSVGLDGSRYKSGKAYQSKKMSGLFYGMAESAALQDDASKLSEALAEKRRKEEEAKAAIEERVARKNARASQIVSLIGSVAMAGITSGITSGMKSGYFGERGLRMASGMKFGEEGPVAPKMFDKYANGGYISGTPGIDQIPAMLSEGEYVIRASSARQLGRPLLDRINAGKFNDGGPVDGNPETSNSTSSSGDVNIDISINVEKGSTSEKQNNSSSNSGDTGSKEKGEMLGIAKKVKEQVLSVIIEEQRPGGLLSK